jgi:hypothetical protein
VAREIQLRRHTDADEAVLTAEGLPAALKIRVVVAYLGSVSASAVRAKCCLTVLGGVRQNR